jgi:hypothetical protein
MKAYLEEMGVREIWYLVSWDERKDGDQPVGSRKRVVARPMAGWTAHPFWKALQ